MLHAIPRPVQTGALFLLLSANAAADLFPINPGDFSGNETVITFSGLPAGTPVAGNYIGQGAFFGFGLFAANETDTATNTFSVFLTNPITVEFLDTIARVGFDVTAGDGDLMVLTAVDTNGDLAGSIPFIIGSSYSFVGIESDLGISQVWIDDASFPGTFSIQNLRFDSRPEGVVPEPWSVILTGTVALIVVWRRRG
jgi:hypothetical protein